MAKFDLKEHDKKMKKILSPTIPLGGGLKEAIRRRIPRKPKEIR